MGFIEYYGWKIYYNEDIQDCLTESEKLAGAIALDYTPDWEYMRNNSKDNKEDIIKFIKSANEY